MTGNRALVQEVRTAASQVAGGCCAYTQRTYPNGHALGDRVPTASTGPSRPLLHMRLKAFAGPFGVCYQVVTRTSWQLVALSGLHLNSISLRKAAAAVAPSRATTRCPASLLASRRTYTALYRIYPHQRVSRYKSERGSVCAGSALLMRLVVEPFKSHCCHAAIAAYWHGESRRLRIFMRKLDYKKE